MTRVCTIVVEEGDLFSGAPGRACLRPLPCPIHGGGTMINSHLDAIEARSAGLGSGRRARVSRINRKRK